jgi:hypothetical protein
MTKILARQLLPQSNQALCFFWFSSDAELVAEGPTCKAYNGPVGPQQHSPQAIMVTQKEAREAVTSPRSPKKEVPPRLGPIPCLSRRPPLHPERRRRQRPTCQPPTHAGNPTRVRIRWRRKEPAGGAVFRRRCGRTCGSSSSPATVDESERTLDAGTGSMMHLPSRRVHDFAPAMYYTILRAFYWIIDWKTPLLFHGDFVITRSKIHICIVTYRNTHTEVQILLHYQYLYILP